MRPAGARPYRREVIAARRVRLAAGLLAAGLPLLVACSGSGGRSAAAGPRTAHSASPTPAVTTLTAGPRPPARPAGPALSPLTGLPARPGAKVLAVKIDNTVPAHPQIGLRDADVVYVEQVEGQLTRLLAIFASRLPAQVGPVRSARESDVALLREYGRVALGFAGASSGVLAIVRASPLLDASVDVLPGSYFCGSPLVRRRAPYNLFLHPAAVLAGRPASAPVRDIGLRFGPVGGGAVARGGSLRFGPYARIGWRYVPTSRSWAVSMDGRAPDAAPANVLVQYVALRTTRFVDVLGNPTPYTVTIGSGAATVFRDGRRLDGRWSRPSAAAGTRFTDAHGHDLLLRPGRTWVVLAPVGLALTVG